MNNYFAGLDLGPPSEFTALAILEQTKVPDPSLPDSTLNHCALRHLARWPPGTPFTAIAEQTKRVFAEPPVAGSTLAIDVTGVGKSVLPLFTRIGLSADIRAVL